MRVELLTIGAELLNGATVNSNAADLSRRLVRLGLRCARHVTVGDDRAELLGALTDALGRADVILTTGGLGPTFDDVTMATIAEATARPLTYDSSAAVQIRRFYTRRHRRLQRAALRQAYVPRGGVALPNPLGTAPGLWLPLPDRLLVALPGVPREMRVIFDRAVLPRLRRLRGLPAVAQLTLRTAGLVELQIEQRLRRLRLPPAIEVGLYPHLQMVDVRLTVAADSAAAARRILRKPAARLTQALGANLYGEEDDTLEQVVGRLLAARRTTLGVAESCTGGLASHQLTNVPGSSRYLRGSLVAYHNDLKRGCLGVAAAALQRYGAVSAQVAKAMAQGVRRLTGASLGLSITGIAGPGGGTARKPVGLVYAALADRRGTQTRMFRFSGDRTAIKIQAAQSALDWLRRYLQGKDSL